MSNWKKNLFYVVLFGFLAIVPVGSSLSAQPQQAYYNNNTQAQIQTQDVSFGVYVGPGWGGGWHRPYYYNNYYYPYHSYPYYYNYYPYYRGYYWY